MTHYYKLILILSTAFFFSSLKSQGFNSETLRYSGFVENKGQIIDLKHNTNKEVLFLLSDGQTMNTQLRKNGFSYDFFFAQEHSKKVKSHRIDFNFVGSNADVKFEKKLRSINEFNVLLTNTKSAIESYSEITYIDLYPNIDLRFSIQEKTQRVKYDFIIKPGGRLSDIQLETKGFDDFEFIENDLQFRIGDYSFTESIPKSWIDISMQEVAVQFQIKSLNSKHIILSFLQPETLKLDSETLIIDPMPQLSWSTYYGDSLETVGKSIITNVNNEVFVCGYTNSIQNIATSGAFQDEFSMSFMDAFILKMDRHGNRIWATYYGGNGQDIANKIYVDHDLNIFVVGSTTSSNLVISDSSYSDTYSGNQDGFILKLNPNGSLAWSSYIGTSGMDELISVCTDFSGNVYATGNTDSIFVDFISPTAFHPNLLGGTDAFLVKFDSLGSLQWASYFGGSANDSVQSITLTDSSLFIVGYTFSSDSVASETAFQNQLNGITDGFIAKFHTDGTFAWSSYFGGEGEDRINGIRAFNQHIYFTGTTSSDSLLLLGDTVYQQQKNGEKDAFIARISTDGNIIWSSYLGGELDDYGMDVSVELDSNVFVLGTTFSLTGIASEDTFQESLHGESDVFVAKFNTEGIRLWSTYYGGEKAEIAGGIDVYGNTAIYVVGTTYSDSIPFPESNYGSIKDSLVGNHEAFVTKLIQGKSTAPGGGHCSGVGGESKDGYCEGETVTLSISGGELGTDAIWTWYKNDCGEFGEIVGNGESITVIAEYGVDYFVRAESITNSTECVYIELVVYPSLVASILSDTLVCSGIDYQFITSSYSVYHWYGPHEFYSEETSPLFLDIQIEQSGMYHLYVESTHGCSDSISFNLNVLPSPSISAEITHESCLGSADGTVLLEFQSEGESILYWNQVVIDSSLVTNLAVGSYVAQIENEVGCKDSIQIQINPGYVIEFDKQIVHSDCGQLNGQITFSPVENTVTWNGDTLQNANLSNLDAGIYVFTINNSYNCPAIDSVEILMLDNLIVTADPTFALVEAGTEVPISLNSDFHLSGFSIQWNPSAYLSCDTCVQTISTPNESINYEITLTHPSGCGATTYSSIELRTSCVDIFIPTHFSPNNDGLNETWCVIGTCINRFLMRVYNEWGELIFVSDSQTNCWDGTYLGVPVQMDSYSYQFEASLTNGNLVQLTGTVVVNP